MKIVGSTDDGYLVQVSNSEMCQLVNGHPYTASIKDTEVDVYRMKTNTVINLNKVYEKYVKIKEWKTGTDSGWDNTRRRLEELLEALEPIEGFVKEVQDIQNEDKQ